MIEESLKEVLLSDAAVSELVGGVQERIWPLAIPQHAQGDASKLPCLVYRLVSEERGRTFCETDDLVDAVYQFDSYSRNFDKCRDLDRSVRAALKDYTGLVSGVRIHTVMVGAGFQLQDPDPGLYRVSRTFNVWYKE